MAHSTGGTVKADEVNFFFRDEHGKYKHVHSDFYNDFDDLFDDDNWAKMKSDPKQ